MQQESKKIVGSAEWCSLPELPIPAIKARVDSGAKTSSLHAFNIQPFEQQGKTYVTFEVHPLQNNRATLVRCKALVLDKRNVKSSTGISEKRYVVRTMLRLGGEEWPIELTLANRDSMGYRMLLGREAMSGRVLVDPEVEFHAGHVSKERLGKLYKANQITGRGLKIALIASNPMLYSNQRIIEAGEQRGHEMIFLNIKQCYMRLDAMAPEVRYRGGTVVSDLDAVIPRIRPNMTFYGCALTRQFHSMGVYCLNDALAITQSRDKLHSLQRLLGNGIDIPITGFAHSPQETDDLMHMVGGAPLIVKLLEGTQGKGVVLGETKKAAESLINAFKSLQANILVQEFIKEANGTDIRCFVIDGKVVASMKRTAQAGDFRANLHQGGSVEEVQITTAERRLAIKAAKTMGLVVAGVDIIRSTKGPLLLEVNSSPGLEGIEGSTQKDIASAMIAAIEKKLGWNRN